MNQSPSILLVDDEDDARDVLVRGLQRLGYNAKGAHDGVEALSMMSSEITIVITDLLMPRLDGLGLLAALRNDYPDTRRVVITSFGDKERVLAALNAGADYLLEKPFGVQQLASIITRLCNENAQEVQLERWFKRRLDSLGFSPREHDLVVLVTKGLGNKEIAQQLSISEQTVKNTLFSMYQKLGIASRGELFHLLFPV